MPFLSLRIFSILESGSDEASKQSPIGYWSYLSKRLLVYEVSFSFGLLEKCISMLSDVCTFSTISNRAEAVQSFSSKPFFKSWDPRVLSKHLQFGLRPILSDSSSSSESGNGPCTLSCNKWHEASAFATSLLGSWGFSSLKSGKFNANY